MVALNYQAQDRACGYNRALFRSNGQCGYVLKAPQLQPNSKCAFFVYFKNRENIETIYWQGVWHASGFWVSLRCGQRGADLG